MQHHNPVAPDIELMQDLLLHPAVKYPNVAAALTLEDSWSFGRLLVRARQYAAALRTSGLCSGERVGLFMENSPEYVAAYFGTFLSGGAAVPLDYKAQPQILAEIVCNCEMSRLIVSLAQIRPARRILDHPQHLRWIIAPSGLAQLPEPVQHLVVDNFKESELEVRPDPAQPAVINYTSGSSGRPKGVVLSHRAILANTRSIVAYLELSQQDRMMQILPFFYCYGASLLHTHFMVGGSLVIDNRFLYPSAVLSNMKSMGCTGFAGVPSTFHTLMTKCDLRRAVYPELRYMTQAGGRLDPSLVDTIRDAIAPARFFVMYGQTEASARLTYLSPERWTDKRGSVGRPIPGVSLKVVSETGAELGPNAIGEIWVRGENLMSGYWGQPEETAQVLIDGWLRTRDLGRLDEEGFLFIEGRIQSFIKSNGYRVSTVEVEEVLFRHPAVHEAAVLGIPDPRQGEQISAVLSLKTGQVISEKELINHCKAILPSYKVPQRILLVPELPKSSSGKVQREGLVSLFEGFRDTNEFICK